MATRASDGAALHFVGEDLHRVVLSRPQARAYRVEAVGDEVVELPLEATYLGERPKLDPRSRLNGGRRSSRWAGAASRWSRRTPPSTTTCSSLADSATVPQICLLPTASGDGEAQIRQFHATFGSRACEPMHISLFRLGSRPIPLRETLLDQHIIYVGGGSMLGLLAVWRALGLDRSCASAGSPAWSSRACRPARCAGSSGA